MKSNLTSSSIFLGMFCCILIFSCNNKTIEKTPTSEQRKVAKEKTIENMLSAYKAEKTSIAKYEAFSKKAEEDGFHNVALLYNAAAASENIHAINHKAVIEDDGGTLPIFTPQFQVNSTKENLENNIKEETLAAKTKYPDYLKTAEIAEDLIAHLSLTYAMKTEQKHKFFFEQALGDINSNTLNSLPSKYYVCPACGNIYTDAPRHCDFSLTDREKFIVFQ
ncbi:rubrerythrin family protein [Lacihabitans sp. LS3-19]|uniref:rubrerythrin family protein n=1 Tax=Lacihabitans sp. LS3-19 TaxID=2487335 RepID=UPI0020CFAED1|nr:ferritin family protein [Lacihabitans sp. LS3-19]MCP9769880.1 rubrerythrin family protein [Lacihabitans sp. LS3-19]